MARRASSAMARRNGGPCLRAASGGKPCALTSQNSRRLGNRIPWHEEGSSRRSQRELLEDVTIARHQAPVAACRQGHFADVDVAVRIDADTVGSEEVSGSRRILAATPARQE